MLNTTHLVDPELAQALAGAPSLKPTAESLPTLRAFMVGYRAAAPPAPAEVTVEERLLPRADGTALRVLVYAPAAPTRTGALLWLHPGGMVMGFAEMNEPQSRFLAHTLGCVVVAVDYRLAPEHPYPAGVEDGYLALRWLHDASAALHFPAARIAVAGESGGGSLAAALALLARDRGEVALSAQFLQYPMLDDRTGTPAEPDPMPYAGEFIWTRADNRFAWGAVLGHAPGGPDAPAYAAPARVEDLAGLPPTYLLVGALDLFVGENLQYAQRLIRQGVPTELHVYAGAYHAFTSFGGEAQVGQRAKQDFWRAMARHFRGHGQL
ncbi:alpha/beta hydrolase [Hymenobacter sp. UV11]|uniref:alpha/beta hydrolase n=1 Tax=Hymenobacter sp. UV11 TaxID=1849735 RepID=UPI00106011B7|nr:alpha/beta hydrolase [Hymenobacter sp. UV11]TDN37081.1 hypothetical protein A8B98_05715 [Hymenobacter sp. UV11]TFZ62681.1 alpha/beta hydrolase [Hymenobacter sp. UV11]